MSHQVPPNNLDRLADEQMANVPEHLEPEPMPVVPLGDLEGASIPEPRFVVDPIIPRRVVTLLGADGGSGKTLLMLALAAHIACGRQWGPFSVVMGHVLFVELEDEADLVRYRMARVVRAYGLDSGAVAENVTLVDGASIDAALVEEHNLMGDHVLQDSGGHMAQLARLARDKDLVMIDSGADAYLANVNSDVLVRDFVRKRLGRIARDCDCGMLLALHIDKSGARYGTAGQSYVGTREWNNSTRCRLALLAKDGEPQLVTEALRFGKRPEPVSLRWHELGVPMPTSGAAVDSDADRADDDEVLAALRKAIEGGQSISPSRNAGKTAQHILETFGLPDQLSGKSNARRFWSAMNRLTERGCVRSEEYLNAYRSKRSRLALGPASTLCVASPPIPPSDLTRGADAPRQARVGLRQLQPDAHLTQPDAEGIAKDAGAQVQTCAEPAEPAQPVPDEGAL